MAVTGWPAWTAPPGGRSAAMSTHDQATWSTWTSRSWAASLQVAATESTAGLLEHATVAPTDQAAVTTPCTPRSTTIPAWPMSRSWVTSGRRPASVLAARPPLVRPARVTVQRVLTDNGVGDRSRLFGAALADTGVRHQRTRPYRPQTNGKVERCNRTLLEEWAYRRLDRSNAARDRAWPPWVHRYNHHRAPTPSAGGHPSAASTTSLVTTASCKSTRSKAVLSAAQLALLGQRRGQRSTLRYLGLP
jgi:Integrase core domain